MARDFEDELICDLAETYHILDYKMLPASQVAVLAYGLRDNSRTKLAMSQAKLSFDSMMLAAVHDLLSVLLWSKTVDGMKNINRPKGILSIVNGEVSDEKDHSVFESPEDFLSARNAIIYGKEEVDGDRIR